MSDDQGTSPGTPPGTSPGTDPDGMEPTPSGIEVYPVDRIKRRLRRRIGGRPTMVYVVLLAGAATLLLLLGVVWISATNNGNDEQEICTQIAPADAQAAVLDGQVRRIRVLVDQDQPVDTLTGIVLELADKSCRTTPQGADQRPELFRVLGSVELFNHFSDGSGVDVAYTQQDIQRELLATSTPVPTDTPTALPATPTAEVIDTATASPSPSPTATPSQTAAPTVTSTRTTGPTASSTATLPPTATSPSTATMLASTVTARATASPPVTPTP